MVKKEPKPKKPLPSLSEPLRNLGGGLRDILVSAASHPATAGLAVMVLAETVKLATGSYGYPRTERKQDIEREMTGLYNGAQALAAGAMIVPVAIGAINLAAQMVAKPVAEVKK